MPLIAQMPIPVIFWGILSIVLLGFVASWLFIAYRLDNRRSFLPRYEPRPSVPWTGFDLLLIVAFYIFVIFLIQGSIFLTKKISPHDRQGAEPKIERSISSKETESERTTEHPLAQLLKYRNPAVLILCVSVGVVIVPIFEEFFFRLLLTGWLLSAERRCRRRWPAYFKSRGLLAIHLSSAVFAALHFRSAGREIEETNLVLSMTVLAAVSFLTLAFALIWLVNVHGASARELGWDRQKWKDDLKTGIIAFFATALPLYVAQVVLMLYVLPKEIAPDPIALYFFAVVLGAMYFRTGRLLPSVVTHMLLNAFSLGLALSMA